MGHKLRHKPFLKNNNLKQIQGFQREGVESRLRLQYFRKARVNESRLDGILNYGIMFW